MAPEQTNSSFDYLNKLNVQQLREILRLQLDEEEVNIELIKKINAVLESKAEEIDLDVDSAYARLRAAEGSEPLYGEVVDEMAAESRPRKAAGHHPKVRSLLRVGLVAAVMIVLFIGTGIVASAMGFDFWGAMSDWTSDRFGFLMGEDMSGNLYSEDGIEASYSELEKALDANGVTVNVVPKYMPSGFLVSSVTSSECTRGHNVVCTLTNNDKEIILNYVVLLEEPAIVFVKDEGSPNIYAKEGIEHYILTNEGSYLATWINQNVQCEIFNVEEEEELLKMIDSIYEER